MRTTSSPELRQFDSGVAFDMQFLRGALPDVEAALFFGKLYKLTPTELSWLLIDLFPHLDVIQALTEGTHSTELQGWLSDIYPHLELVYTNSPEQDIDAQLLPQLWEAAEIMIATSIQEVGDRVGQFMNSLPTHEAQMTFKAMSVLNRKRNSIGDYSTLITRREDERKRKVLVILDDSGSMTQQTIETIVQDVVALAYKANATLALVSSTARVFSAGTFSVADVLENAEYQNTVYSSLVPLFYEDWDEVVTIADYDSYGSTPHDFVKCSGRVGTVTDISLVGTPTFLSECVGTLAQEVRPVLISHNVM